jgi:exo-beta-1,3-glucanase (GH17 family)
VTSAFNHQLSNHKIKYLLLVNVILLAGLIGWFIHKNTPVKLASVPVEKLQCVSYAPYYKTGQTPFNPQMMISPEQVEADLTLLSKQFNCVRTYSVNQGLDHVPVAAQKLNMQVMLGAWIGWTERNNIAELDKAVDLANTYPNTIKALIIGNEVLLRGEQTEATLKRYLNKAKSATQTPITYADVWEFWRKHPKLEAEVDFVTTHILPYWEDDPQSVEVAILHTTDIMALLDSTFQKPIFIGETGWPSEGRQRNTSVPSHVNQARYIRDFLAVAHTKNWQYNIIEAIDQPWKRELEGTVGGYWGIYNSDLTPKFSFTNAVAERNDNLKSLFITMLGLLLFVGLGLWLKVNKFQHTLHTAVLGTLTGLAAVVQIEYLMTASRSMYEWAYLGGLTTMSILMLLAIVVLSIQTCKRSKQWLNVGFLLIILTVFITNLSLTLDGRYINHPIALYALISTQLLLLSIFSGESIKASFIPRWFAWVLMASALGCLLHEYNNTNAIIWVCINLMLFIVVLRTKKSPAVIHAFE